MDVALTGEMNAFGEIQEIVFLSGVVINNISFKIFSDYAASFLEIGGVKISKNAVAED